MSDAVKLTSMVKTSGCAAKLAPEVLHQVLSGLPQVKSDRLLVGYETSDDALAYQIDDHTALLQTVDFFPPMVDDPFLFGQIAAANAISDVYAMGGTPVTAMNLLCFPACLPTQVMRDILEGGASKAKEAGVVIAGGHTISDPTPKYGLCVTGLCHPQRILRNSTARPGDLLVLTKPLGVGVYNTAHKAELLTEEQFAPAAASMSTLNRQAAECAREVIVHACTDVTGFGLMGHACEMAEGSGCTIRLWSEKLLFLPQAEELAAMGLLPEGMYNNLHYLREKYVLSRPLSQSRVDLLFDPQTSGGLLLALPPQAAREYLSRMEQFTGWARIIGEVLPQGDCPLVVE
ncbi:MAG: selenide, water dikinase SelD [Eubacteriales bacterium]|jgi:selenide,water dikinase